MIVLNKALFSIVVVSGSLLSCTEAKIYARDTANFDEASHSGRHHHHHGGHRKPPVARGLGLLGSLLGSPGIPSNQTGMKSPPHSNLSAAELISLAHRSVRMGNLIECGENGPFTLTFDDLPAPKNDTIYPPIQNPYHNLYFSNGYTYSPPPNDPFQPISPPKLAVFLPNTTNEVNDNTDAGLELVGEISAGPRMQLNEFWFNVSSVYVGCSEPGPNQCQWDAVAFKYDPNTGTQTTAGNHLFQTPPCDGASCKLTYVEFPSDFSGLSGVQFYAYVDDAPVSWSMDNLSMGWYNTSCAAGLSRVQNSI